MSQITFGRFSPFNTFIHKLDSRNKILLLILLFVTIFLKVSVWSTALIISGIILLILVGLFAIAKISFIDLFKSLKAMWLLIVFLLIIYIFIPNSSYNPSHIAFYIGKYGVNYDAFYQAGYIILRIIMILMIMMLLTSTTSPMNLTYGFEWYMTPLKLVKFPSHIVAMTLSIALRFIPTLLDETDRIIKAQSSRGVNFTSRGFKRFSALISLVVPLFISAIGITEVSGGSRHFYEATGSGYRNKVAAVGFTVGSLSMVGLPAMPESHFCSAGLPIPTSSPQRWSMRQSLLPLATTLERSVLSRC